MASCVGDNLSYNINREELSGRVVSGRFGVVPFKRNVTNLILSRVCVTQIREDHRSARADTIEALCPSFHLET